MKKLDRIEEQVQALSPEELAEFRDWFLEFDWAAWDRQIEQDVPEGKLDRLIDAARSEHEAGRTKYLMTNALHLTNQEHIFWYRLRWAIEVFFRDIKQHLNLTTCEARSEEVIIAHVVLVCIAYTFMQLLKPLASQQRPSIGITIKTIVPLLITDTRQFARPNPSGSFQVVSFDHLVLAFRTRFSNLPCTENPLLT